MCRSDRGGFSLIEVIFVLVILGIITTLAMQKSSDTSLYQARDQIISHMRYAQHLAMSDDKYIGGTQLAPGVNRRAEAEEWPKRLWRIQFHTISNAAEGNIGETYSVYSNSPTASGTYNNNPMGYSSIARDPISQKCLSYYNKNNLPSKCENERDNRLRLQKSFGITSVSMKSDCAANQRTIYFDYLGVPYCGGVSPKKLNSRAQITLTRGGQSVAICVEPLTGYVHSCNN
ncbi:pilus assembly FimT family protein [Wolinella succinogenes]|uniref:pilus assembly FimT family protein n=1 Tax=Wolinella succinogenes TaxID=844 RepID=UPI00240931B0|nr:type II secretion system protein [Wolinella succinogenes]